MPCSSGGAARPCRSRELRGRQRRSARSCPCGSCLQQHYGRLDWAPLKRRALRGHWQSRVSHVQLSSRSLSASGRFCRCQIDVAVTPPADPAADQSSLEATATDDATGYGLDRVLAAEAEALANGAVTLLMRHLEAASLSWSAVASAKAYHVGSAGACMSDALAVAWRQQTDEHDELCSLPALAVGMTMALNAFLLMECTATAATTEE